MAGAEEFFEAAGRSLGGAQGSLVGPSTDLPTGIAIADAELEVRAVVDRGEKGLELQPVSAELARRGELDPALVSTVTVRYVAVAATAKPARRTSAEVTDAIRRRPDLTRLEKIVGKLSYEAQYVPAGDRWLVTVRDPAGRAVREVILPDDA